MDAKKILQQHAFRSTEHRCTVLDYFMQSNRAITHSDLEIYFKGKINRVSLYRMLHSFSEAKIICKIIDHNGVISYILDKNTREHKSDPHPQFKCKTCHDVVELPELPKEYLAQLSSLNIDHMNILAEGTCKECENKSI